MRKGIFSMNDARDGLGGNFPPSIILPTPEQLVALLEREHAELVTRAAELSATADKVPADIKDDETHGKANDLAKQMRFCESDLANRRKLEKQPYTALGATVDAIFGNRKDELKDKRTIITERVKARTDWKE